MTHPLDRLTAAEIDLNHAILTEHGLVGPATRFALVLLAEPPKSEVLAWTPGRPWDRQVSTVLLDRETGDVREVLTSLTTGSVVSERVVDVRAEGQPPILGEEFALVEEILWGHDGWNAAMARRGLTEPRRVRISALSAGVFEIPGEQGRRLVRCLGFLQLGDDDNAWAHPIDGVVAYVDLISRDVVRVIDDAVLPVPTGAADFHLPAPARTTQRPIHITQPEGPGFTVDGDVVTWEKWRFRIGFDQVEGLTLHQIGFADGGRLRPIVYRASVAEMVVPYGDPSPVRFWQNYFDAGEYSLGKEANALTLGCDCLGEIHYFDAVIADDDGRPRRLPNAICLHEEDHGLLWKHTDMYNGSSSVRRQRRLVISFFITVGNYDYGFYWYLYLDGTIELECKATGVVFASAYPATYGPDYPWAGEIAPGVGAPYHQHLFSARLDMMIDGVGNAVDEVDACRVPVSERNPYGNAFTRRATRLRRESDGARLAAGAVGRTWHIVNPSVRNGLGRPVGYALHPEGRPTLLADDTSSIARRAAFTTRHLWVTAQDDAQRYPAGRFVNQNPGLTGIDAWIKADRDIDGTDIVVWHTFGLTHFPRPEDWPIMPVDYTGFVLKPAGFFDRNPALDTPPPQAHGTTSGESGSCCRGDG